MKYFILLLVFGLAIGACKKDDVLSDAARVSQELQRATGSATDVVVFVYNTSQALQGQSTGLVIEGDYVIVDQVHYNLGRLVSYRYFPPANASLKPALRLYFWLD